MINAKNVGEGIILTDSADYVPLSVCEKMPQYVLQYGDILFGRAGSIERHAFIDENYAGCFQGTNCIRIRCNNTSYAKFITYYLSLPSLKRTIEKNAGGSTMSYLSTDLLKEINIIFPLEIKKCTNMLSLLDKKIQSNKRIIAELEDMAKTIYDYWFTQFDFPDENGNPYKSSGGTMVYNEELKREIPLGWKSQSMTKNSLFTIIKPGVELFEQKEYLATAEVNGSFISKGNVVDHATRESRANMQPKVNTVWFAKMKNSVKHLFLNKEMQSMIDSTILSTGFCGLQCNEMSFEFVSSFIASMYFETIKDVLAHGATQEAVNNDDLGSIFIAIPKENVLENYHILNKGVFAKKSKLMIENQQLTDLRDWLLPMLMNGQATVVDEVNE
ncbi:MAG: restriction endonuclease subunit S [Clostridia bacterium]